MSALAWILLIVFIAFFLFEVFAFVSSAIKKNKEKKLKANTKVDVNDVVDPIPVEDGSTKEDTQQ